MDNEINNLGKPKSVLLNTDSEPRPGDFPLGSLKSRAAARAKLEQIKNDPGEVIQIIIEQVGGGPSEIVNMRVDPGFFKNTRRR